MLLRRRRRHLCQRTLLRYRTGPRATSSIASSPAIRPLHALARVQGTVELRAIISKAGTIENLIVVSGHPMLVKSAIEAVRQWRYRPYLLNNEPIEVETEITVNFVLSGS